MKFSLKALKVLWIGQNRFGEFLIERILDELPQLRKLYCYSYLLNNDDDNIDSAFLEAAKIKGSCLQYFKSARISQVINQNNQPELQLKNKRIKYLSGNMKKVFISYAHGDDIQWLNRVKSHLKVLQLEDSEIEAWDDTRIKPGTKWKEEISSELEQAAIAILLVSTNFLASDFIRTNELPPLLKSAKAKGTLILSLIISPCRFLKIKDLPDFQTVNDPKVTLSEMTHPEQEREFLKLVEAIDSHISSNV